MPRKKKPRQLIPDDRICQNPHCNNIFAPLRFWQKYCSEECRMTAYYLRKFKVTGIDALDLMLDTKQGPTTTQEEEWKQRTVDREKLEAEAKNAASMDSMVQHADKMADAINQGKKITSLEDLGYAPKPNPQPREND